MYTLKDKIFSFFGRHAKTNDTYKNGDGKGIWERYNEALAEDYDENVGVLINGFIDNLLNPHLVQDKFIPYLEGMLGNVVKVYDDIVFRRKILSFAIRIYQIKGTKKSFEMLFKMAGFTDVVITEDFTGTGFDSPLTLDDPVRRFDQGGCPTCTNYTLSLTGEGALTAEKKEVILNIIRFLEPINARLTELLYNGGDITNDIISINIDEYGNLSYNNDADLTLTLKIVGGNLTIVGPNAGNYTIDEHGNFKYIK